MSAGFEFEVDGEIARLTFARPEKQNAISYEMWSSIPDVVARVEDDPAATALVLSGAGENFSAGADISEFGSARSNVDGAALYDKAVHAAVDALARMAKPSIAMIRGNCIGGGCQLSVACDFRFAAHGARFGITPSKLGIVYDFESTRQLVSLLGPAKARLVLLTGELLDAERAAEIGLIDKLLPDAELAQVTDAFVAKIGTRSQYAVRSMNRIIAKIAAGQTETDSDVERIRRDAIEGADYAEGVRAFLERRRPEFPYR